MIKYQQWHDAIISRARSRPPIKEGEKHHIIPKFMGGPINGEIVVLTYREHYLIHWILLRIVPEKYVCKAAFALSRMSSCPPTGKRKVASWQYALSKIASLRAKNLFWTKEKRHEFAMQRMGKNNPFFGKAHGEKWLTQAAAQLTAQNKKPWSVERRARWSKFKTGKKRPNHSDFMKTLWKRKHATA